MDTNYLEEAFKRLSLLEDDFDITADVGKVDELKSFIDDDVDEIPEEEIIDVNADDESELQDNYIGKVILECECCHSRLYKDEADVIIDEESGLANVDEQCPVCNNELGYTVIGKIEPFNQDREIKPEEEEEIPDEEVEELPADDVEIEEVEEEEVKESLQNRIARRHLRKNLGENLGGAPAEDPKDLGLDPDTAVEDDVKLETPQENPIKESKKLTEADEASTLEGIFKSTKDALESDPKAGHRILWFYGEDGNFDTRLKSWAGKAGKILLPVKSVEDLKNLASARNKNILILDASSGELDNIIKALKTSTAGSKALYSIVRTKDPTALNTLKKYIDDKYTDKGTKPNELAQPEKPAEAPENESLTEGIENLSLETDAQHIEVHSTEDGGVSLTAEPVENANEDWQEPGGDLLPEPDDAESGEEEIVPLDAEDEANIEDNKPEGEEEEEAPAEEEPTEEAPAEGEETETTEEEPEEEEVEVDEVEEENFDEMGESYMRKVYGNVKSYKTTKINESNNTVIIEGLITFTSGKTKTTKFVFENASFSKRGKLVLEGYNRTFTNANKAFMLRGSLVDKKYIPESLIYNYKVKQLNESTGSDETIRVYGRIKKR